MQHYVIIDLEMCRIVHTEEYDENELYHEIIQIGAVSLDENYEICDEYMAYVKPQYGTIDTFITNLTGITSEDIEEALVLQDALELFAAWLPEDPILVAWSENDEKQIRHEAQYKKINLADFDYYFGEWEDCQAAFGEKMNTPKNYSLKEALCIAGIQSEPGEHDGLIDAKNTAKIFAKLKKDKDFKLNPYYGDANDNHSSYNPFADLFAHFQFDEE